MEFPFFLFMAICNAYALAFVKETVEEWNQETKELLKVILLSLEEVSCPDHLRRVSLEIDSVFRRVDLYMKSHKDASDRQREANHKKIEEKHRQDYNKNQSALNYTY